MRYSEILRYSGRAIGLIILLLVYLAGRTPPTVQAVGTPISLTASGTAVTENFDTLAITGTANTALPVGWGFVEAGTNANTTYAADNGAGAGGNTYSFGTTGMTDRAFGELTSGTLQSTIGACFTNNTGANIGVLQIAFTGEQWRSGDTANVPDSLTFEYSLNATSLNDAAATWVAVSALDFTGPITTAAAGALDGNAAANRTAKLFGIDNLTIPNGNTFFIRWRSNNIAGTDDSLGIDDFSLTPFGPTSARVEKYAAYRLPEGNLVRWQSSFESHNLGFNIYRQQGRQRVRVTPGLIAGSALKYGAGTLLSGDTYSWRDKDGTAESVYWIEDVDANGITRRHGPVAVAKSDAVNDSAAPSSRLLNDLQPGSGTGAQTYQVLPEGLANRAAQQIVPGSDAWQRQLQLANRPAVKLDVRQSGWYRVTGAQLQAAGIGNVADARLLQLYADGVQVPLALSNTNNSNVLDASAKLEFYGLARDTVASDTRSYWLVNGTEPGLRIAAPRKGGTIWNIDPEAGNGNGSAKETGTAKIADTRRPIEPAGRDSFAYTVERSDRVFYAPTIHNGAADNYYSAAISPATVSQVLRVNRLDIGAATPARVEVALQGATDGPHNVRITLNGQELGMVTLNGADRRTAQFEAPQSVLQEGDNTVSLTATGNSGDISLLEYTRLTYAHRWTADNNYLLLTTGRRSGLTINGFTSPRVRVFDVTNPQSQFELAIRNTGDAAGYAVTLTGNLDNRTLVAVADEQYQTPANITANEVSHWTDNTQTADFVILVPAAWRNAVTPLAEARQSQGFRTQIINVEDIYDEWNAGAPSAATIRDFLQWTKTNWPAAPRYVLLAGDASYDPRNYLGSGVSDTVPTGTADTADFETASDEALVDFDGDGIGEMAVGRLPARSESELQALVSKTLGFTPLRRLSAVLVADQSNGYDFSALNAAARRQLTDGAEVTVINRAGQTDTAVRAQIISAFNQGPGLVQYAGHGSVQGWTGAPLFDNSDAMALTNGSRLPFVSLMTCLNGYFIDTQNDSLAEALLRAPNGGAAAVWASTALTNAPGQALISQELFRRLGNTDTAMRLGDAVRAAKLATSDTAVRRTWVLFGDPTLTLRQ